MNAASMIRDSLSARQSEYERVAPDMGQEYQSAPMPLSQRSTDSRNVFGPIAAEEFEAEMSRQLRRERSDKRKQMRNVQRQLSPWTWIPVVVLMILMIAFAIYLKLLGRRTGLVGNSFACLPEHVAGGVVAGAKEKDIATVHCDEGFDPTARVGMLRCLSSLQLCNLTESRRSGRGWAWKSDRRDSGMQPSICESYDPGAFATDEEHFQRRKALQEIVEASAPSASIFGATENGRLCKPVSANSSSST